MLDNATKVCRLCGQDRPVSSFASAPGSKLKGRDRVNCEPCAVRTRAYNAAHRQRHKAGHELYGRKLKTLYGMSLDNFQSMRMAQGNRCLVCLTVFSSTGNNRDMDCPVVDHCHGRGTVRGILCRRCNIGLGMFRDDPAALTRASTYVGTPDIEWD